MTRRPWSEQVMNMNEGDRVTSVTTVKESERDR